MNVLTLFTNSRAGPKIKKANICFCCFLFINAVMPFIIICQIFYAWYENLVDLIFMYCSSVFVCVPREQNKRKREWYRFRFRVVLVSVKRGYYYFIYDGTFLCTPNPVRCNISISDMFHKLQQSEQAFYFLLVNITTHH